MRYKLYLPASLDTVSAPPPLLVMLHGCNQTAEDFAKGTRMNEIGEEKGVIVLYPWQGRQAHPNRCWNWYRAGDRKRDTGETGALAHLVCTIRDRHHADPARVYVAGLSAGASTAINLGHLYPDVFAAVGVHSGLPMGAAGDKASALLSMARGNPGIRLDTAVPTIIFHGSEDRVVNPRNGRFLAIRAHETYPTLRPVEIRRQVPGGHGFLRASYRIGRGKTYVEHWTIEGSGHAWSGGSGA
ncbi:MAG: PHB depolymerase family esterase, partial [Paracoccus sp. (in: a-proteobacteria)]|nr:PHB depolymerase family esterase [Paracoccus sp. (in: a-proteobacteria)]